MPLHRSDCTPKLYNFTHFPTTLTHYFLFECWTLHQSDNWNLFWLRPSYFSFAYWPSAFHLLGTAYPAPIFLWEYKFFLMTVKLLFNPIQCEQYPQFVIFKLKKKVCHKKVFHFYLLEFIKCSLLILGFSCMFRKAFPRQWIIITWVILLKQTPMLVFSALDLDLLIQQYAALGCISFSI